MLKISLKLPPSILGAGKIGKIIFEKQKILLNGGVRLKGVLQEHIAMLAATKHDTATRLGARKTGHYDASKVSEPMVEGDRVGIHIGIPGINRALHDIVIHPVEAQSLAIPMHRDAYGIQPREYNARHPKGSKGALFKPKGKDYLAKKKGKKDIVVMYLLRKSVMQKQDRSLLPTDEKMMDALVEGSKEAIEAILKGI